MEKNNFLCDWNQNIFDDSLIIKLATYSLNFLKWFRYKLIHQNTTNEVEFTYLTHLIV